MDQWPELFVLAFPKMLKGLAPVLLWPLYAIRRSIRRRADAIFSLAEKYLHDALSEIPSWKQVETMTIYNGIDVANFRKLLVQNLKGNSCNGSNKKPPGEVWAVFAGTLGNNYDICTIVQAGVLLRERCKVVKLVVAGAGPCLGTIQRGIAEYSLSNLIYCGVYSHEALIGLYSQCDMALCTYGKESNVGMPDKVYDYMAAGLPIINSLSGELKELIESLDIGQQYTPGDPASLAMAITRLAEDEELRRCEAANSFEAAMHFDRDVQFSKICELLARFPVPE
jgi:glycosyltransferase involved in cell wall biosynthesis